MIEVRWHGRGGQGGWSAARLLGAAAALHEGRHAMAFPSFGPERRGAPVLGFTRIDEVRIKDRSEVLDCDAVVVLDETLVVPGVARGLKAGGFALVNTKDPAKYAEVFGGAAGVRVVGIDATGIALEILGKPITNTAMLGALVGATGFVSLEAALKAIASEMRGDLAAKNAEVLRRAYAEAKGATA